MAYDSIQFFRNGGFFGNLCNIQRGGFRMTVNKTIKSTLLILAILAAALLPAQTLLGESTAKSPDYKELRLFREIMGIVQKHYVKDVTDKELVQGAVNGMLQSLDPHSQYLNEEMFKELQVETKGEFGGLGIEITLESGILTIVSPIEDTPAYKAGLKPGDKIIKIDGETTKNITLLKAVKQMRGRPGTKVTLTIMREGFKEFKDYTLERAIIHVRSVKTENLEKGYPYVRIASFQESTDTDLTNAIKEMGEDETIKGMVLDLRNNPGGLLDQAWKVANLFLEKGALIVYTDGRAKDQQMEFKATRTGKHYKFRIAVLINEGSASASEIVAGALQDHDRAVIFGTKSFGKASVQTIIPLDSKSGLRLTTAYYYTPKGRHIQKTGIVPDVDLKAEVKKQQDQEAEEEAKPENKKKPKQSRLMREKADPKTDPVLKKALDWLKSDVTVKQYKLENASKPMPDTALFSK
jgi:carboxyl-terminal processing protease